MLLESWVRRARVVRVVDGDTLEIDVDMGLRVWVCGIRIRLMGVDTPEVKGDTKTAGDAATDATKAWVAAAGGNVMIQTFKRTEAGDDLFDSFGRVLARVSRRDGTGDLGAHLQSLKHATLFR